MARKVNSVERFCTLLCFLIAMSAIVFSPTSSHAASNMHSVHQGVTVSPPDECPHHRDGISRSDRHDTEHTNKDYAPDSHHENNCCDGTCLSVVLGVQNANTSEENGRDVYLLQSKRAASIAESGLIRPPRTLV